MFRLFVTIEGNDGAVAIDSNSTSFRWLSKRSWFQESIEPDPTTEWSENKEKISKVFQFKENEDKSQIAKHTKDAFRILFYDKLKLMIWWSFDAFCSLMQIESTIQK